MGKDSKLYSHPGNKTARNKPRNPAKFAFVSLAWPIGEKQFTRFAASTWKVKISDVSPALVGTTDLRLTLSPIDQSPLPRFEPDH
jgi:hypothetical protein